ncbi:ferredoxin [Paracoccus tegillarcae]|uniref:ferredoxin n=1 Tax=Paracoccus tegillarcae TaxID=1529068 RepID=UPI001E626AC5|nr:ferredoxin [Paracoccus tegillarcae]
MGCNLTAAPEGLFISGHCRIGDAAIALISPDEPGFWDIFTASAELGDGAPDPMDRWSKRVIGAWAARLGGRAVFPSDGPPYPDFVQWALASGRFWQSPVGMLVHDRMGLFASFRGAIILPNALAVTLPAGAHDTPSPCETCPAPCLSACPADAFTPAYQVARCHDWLDRSGKKDCMSQGCGVRRACPISQGCGRLPQQSAWHMRQFHP